MRAIYGALVTVFPLSLDEHRFSLPVNREPVQAALQAITDHAGRLRDHAGSLPGSYEFLRRTLVGDASQAATSYRLGHYESARFLVQDLTGACFGCHTRLPESQRFDLGASFLSEPGVAAMPLDDRARLAAATRQFDAALGYFEQMFEAPESHPVDIAYSSAFEDYLKLALRVHEDTARPLHALSRFVARDDLPRYLRIHVESWMEALRDLSGAELPPDDLQAAREVFREAQLRSAFPQDPRAMVHFVAASRLLHRYVDARPGVSHEATRERLAEAYYLLGVAEAHITSNYWYSETEFFLESAIRLAPRSQMARKAYAWLEEDLLLGYSGSAGTELPPEVAEHLQELRDLIDGHTRPPS